MESYVWLILIVAGIILELSTANLVAIWFVVGFIFALIISFFGVELWIQILVCLIVSIIALILTRPLVRKLTFKKVVRTNADRFIGRIGIVTEDIVDDSGKGRVEVSGQSWAAISLDGRVLKKGERITVDSISGVKFIVIPAEE